jgi:colicin import membrane protein
VELRITLGKQHEVQSISVNKSSGNDEFDRSAIDAVRKAGQFPELEGLTIDDAKRLETIVLRFKPNEHN